MNSDNEIMLCPICGKQVDVNNDPHDANGTYYHEDCLQNHPDEWYICKVCGELCNDDDNGRYYVENYGDVCCSCSSSDEFVVCNDCGAMYFRDDCYEVEGDYYCSGCFEDSDNVVQCADCGRYIYGDNAHYRHGEPYCSDCCNYDDIIRSYHDNPEIKYFPATKNGTKFKGFGIELEIDARNYPDVEDEDLAASLKELFDGHAYFMHDGSLDNGFEIITFPHTKEEFDKIDWQTILQKIKDSGYLSHDIGTCGLHMHISRTIFPDDDSITRVIYFYEHYIQDILKISRRSKYQMNDWAKTYGYGDKTFQQLRDADVLNRYNYGDHCDRYHAVNLTNSNTIEFRLMRGTIKYSTFKATIDFLWTVANNAVKMTNDDVTNPANYLKGIEPTTLDYIHSRRAFENITYNDIKTED